MLVLKLIHVSERGPDGLLVYVMFSRVLCCFPDSKVHGANMGPTWVLSAPDGPHVGPMNLAIQVDFRCYPAVRDIG